MEQVQRVLASLPERHRAALQWFATHAGTVQRWPDPLPDGTLLATKAKGIYKPRWTTYALSVRQALSDVYPDREPVIRPDGTWLYRYFQENIDPAARDLEYTNRGLIECWRDRVPAGVMRQVTGKPQVRYHILGLALVTGWDAGYFLLEGPVLLDL
jgi:putative restriction endonuclease